MKILVPLKRVPDYEARIKLKADGSGVDTAGVKWIVNPFDEIALEEALRQKEAGVADEVVVVSIGPSESAAQLRQGLALGADRALLVLCEAAVDSDLAARVLAAVYRREAGDIVLMGKQAVDSDAGQTPQLLAAQLGIAHACYASKVILEAGAARITREIDGGLETVEITLPCVISVDLRLNTPRYASLPNIIKAKKKPLEEITLAALGVGVEVKTRVLRMRAAPRRKRGEIVASVAELVRALQREGKV
jgi:electron transfer flavoprotein beta subunit